MDLLASLLQPFLTLVSPPDSFGFLQSTGKPFVRLLATACVAGVCLRYGECTSADAHLTPCRRQIHGVHYPGSKRKELQNNEIANQRTLLSRAFTLE
jgi:hypothetical protein